jgi:spore coat polysaccharide biosynthesis predicted glycosyltransferase SpsG/GNAT superfamily N-acetyltransferase
MLPTLSPIVIRVDADRSTGAGHLMRTLALAQHWKDLGGSVVFVINRCERHYLERLQEENFIVVRGDDVSAVAKEYQSEWIILDGYHFDANYRAKLAQHRVLLVDDCGQSDFRGVTAILNQNEHACAELYPGFSGPLLLGLSHVMLRREFVHEQESRKVASVARKVVVSLGGGDFASTIGKILEATATMDVQVTVAGGSDKFRPDLHRVFANADLAIIGGGTTTREVARLGLPAICLVMAENQVEGALSAQRRGSAFNLGPHQEVTIAELRRVIDAVRLDQSTRQQMSDAGRAWIGARGASRVCAFLANMRVHLRLATHADAELLFRWANDPETRARSFQTKPIVWEEHVDWLMRKLSSTDSYLFIGYHDDRPIGTGRIDRLKGAPSEGLLSASIAPDVRGIGYGTELLAAVMLRGHFEFGFTKLHGEAKHDNLVALRMWEKVGLCRLPDSGDIMRSVSDISQIRRAA